MKTVNPDQMLKRLFDRDGRLKAIPSSRPNRRVQLCVVLERLAQEFEPGRRYFEPEVNTILNRFHQDQLRRYLADLGFLHREQGWYWRDKPEAGEPTASSPQLLRQPE